MKDDLQRKADQNIKDILELSLKHHLDSKLQKTLVIYDNQTTLAHILTEAYRCNLLGADYIDFDTSSQIDLIHKFNTLGPGDLVALIQSSNFRLNDFRIRLYLFNRGIKVIEHMHLHRNCQSTWPMYIDSLAYDIEYLTSQSHSIEQALLSAKSLTISYNNQSCLVDSPLEIPKLNIGQYDAMANIGGTYPIGEIFTESQNLQAINGRIWVYAFANSAFEVELAPSPFWLEINNGIITNWDPTTPPSFVTVLNKVQKSESLLIRELGFGINRAFSRRPELLIKDITAFERICGMHMSIGHKHSVYKKSGYPTHKARYHIDIFIQADIIETDTQVIWEGLDYLCK
ncbi:MAG: hypothetical protein H7230_02080 [Candidatus Parcubacteria bacterium]|nr:hypothetical protein [Candidatus Paceibacterota bacterium]